MGAGGASDILAVVKHGEDSETAHLGWSWGELGYTGVDGGIDGEWGMLQGMDGIIGDAAGVHDAGGHKMVCSWGVWGLLSGWDMLWGCSGGSPSMFCHPGAMVDGTEWGRARGGHSCH